MTELEEVIGVWSLIVAVDEVGTGQKVWVASEQSVFRQLAINQVSS